MLRIRNGVKKITKTIYKRLTVLYDVYVKSNTKIFRRIHMAKAIEKEKDAISVEQVIDELAAKANVALKEMEDFDQEKVDHIVHEMAMAALDKHMMLAKMAVGLLYQNPIKRYDTKPTASQPKNSCSMLLLITSINIANVKSDIYEKKRL